MQFQHLSFEKDYSSDADYPILPLNYSSKSGNLLYDSTIDTYKVREYLKLENIEKFIEIS